MTDQAKPTALLSCPFCGALGKLKFDDSMTRSKWGVSCPPCGIGPWWFVTEADATEAWNTRAHSPAQAEWLPIVRDVLTDWRKWYDESLFTPVLTVETQAVHKQFDGMVDRIAAQAARHTVDKLLERLNELEQQ